MSQSLRLEVHDHFKEDVYLDRVRIPVLHRGTIGEGRVAKLSVDLKDIRVEVRGLSGESKAIIRMDEITRSKLGLESNKTYLFEVREEHWSGQFLWAWNASDATARIAARLGLIGVLLGLIAIVPLLKDLVCLLLRKFN
jgi:hypothetical protein